MNESDPHDDQTMRERLSAYYDGELDPAEARSVETEIAADPELAERYARLVATSHALGAWSVDVPEPAPGFLKNIRAKASTSRRPRGAWLIAAACAACFAVGVALGRQTQGVSGPGLSPTSNPSDAAPVSSALSPGQAEVLLRETTASALRERIAGQVQARQWTAAAALLDRLEKEFHDTRAAQQARHDVSLEELARRAGVAGRT